ncbi:hypothetical protein D9615_000154 [Tricholomella constricta]|uniref:C2H2-type domain-containing protein n=1 Tax=Tricholomella constricta TaxID=117010 RepID=A0A8H5HSA7_9AGAR|nr:hypothetical protein D9615_000154 [Tricholomella constricta]
MAHFRCPTFNSLNSHMPNMSPLTLASHIKTSRSSSISPLQASSTAYTLLPQSCLDDNSDFQSNARVETMESSFGSGLHLAGLGITQPQSHTKADSSGLRNTLVEHKYRLITQHNGLQSRVGDELPLLQDELGCLYEHQMTPSWSFSSLMSGTASETVIPTCPLGQDAALQYPGLGISAEMAFDSIAAASGMPADLLAAQLSATADLALRYMERESLSSFTSLVNSASTSEASLLDELLEDQDQQLSWPVLLDYRGDTTPGPEFKRYTESWMEPPLGINPAEITTGALHNSDVLLEHQDLYLPSDAGPSRFSSHYSLNEFFPPMEEIVNDDHCALSSGIPVNPRGVMASENIAYYDFLLPTKLESNSDYEFSEDGHFSKSSSPFPSPRKKKRGPTSKGSKKPTVRPTEAISFHPAPVKLEGPLLDLNLGTPVLNAHKGVDLEDLKAKAERYRHRNPGRMYDNSWLVSFAGKLSNRGELVKEFRCYVHGCSQTNKRRDHILIHVGSHLDQRPFGCSFCPSQFLRKNECKRHELSHSGTKPYVCTICPDTAFVRQDLLKRHTTRTHGVTTARKRKGRGSKGQEKENIGAHPSKRVKRECNTE